MNKVFAALLFTVLNLFCWPAQANWHQFNYVAMTTPISLVLWEEDALRASYVSSVVFREFDEIEQQMTRYTYESELSFVNRLAAQEPVVVSPSLFSVLSAAMSISELSQGAFDITFASVGYLYDYRKRLKPLDAEIQKNIQQINYKHIKLDNTKRSIAFLKEDIILDLGGIAKGYAVDQGIKLLKKQGIKHAHLSAGGDMRLLGDKRGKPWIIGVRHPRSDKEPALMLPLSDVSISTSGDYERYFIDDAGERVHHIISPKTGKSAKGLQSVTVLAPDTITSDGLSTAIFVMGLKEGMTLVNRLEGIDAILIDEHGKVHYSDGLTRPE